MGRVSASPPIDEVRHRRWVIGTLQSLASDGLGAQAPLTVCSGRHQEASMSQSEASIETGALAAAHDFWLRSCALVSEVSAPVCAAAHAAAHQGTGACAMREATVVVGIALFMGWGSTPSAERRRQGELAPGALALLW